MEHNYHTLYSRDYPNYDNNYLDKNILDESGLSIFFYNGIYYLFTCLMIGASGITIAVVCVSIYLYSDYLSYKNTIADFSNSDSDSDSDYDSDLDSEFYDKKYIDEYEELESRKLEDDDINNLKDLFISKKSPIGVIKMCYDRETNAFLYYANSKDILYKYLETVGRFYVIENNCKNLFINSKDEYEKAVKVKEAKILERKQEEDKKLEEEEARKNSIFARFKTYNTNNNNNNKSKIEDIPIIPEKANKYIYKGKLCDYDDYIKSISCNNSTDNENDDFENLDYATFKKLEEKKNS
jgi:hypothetical protein